MNNCKHPLLLYKTSHIAHNRTQPFFSPFLLSSPLSVMMMSGRNSTSSSSSSSNFSRYPFTPTQWQELEQQALIYKYMASGIPIPSDLLLPIKRSFLLNSTQPTMGWSCFQMGYGRKAEDPEPGRCRRTDGKKWRCSKEAYPDSKYCERHMHRGKNRSRKPVEISLSSNNTNNTNSTNNTTTNSSSDPHYPYPLFYPHPCSSPADSSWELRPLGLGEPKQREQDKHCFVLGADFKQETMRPVKERDFFDIGWPQKSKEGSWMGLDHNSSSQDSSSSCSKTQLSISIPMGLHDFPQWLVSLFSPVCNYFIALLFPTLKFFMLYCCR